MTHEVEPREDTGEQPAEPFNIDDGNYTHKLVRKNYVPLVSLQETKFVDDRSIRLNPSDSKYDNHSLYDSIIQRTAIGRLNDERFTS